MSWRLNSALSLLRSALADLEQQAREDREKGEHCCMSHTALSHAQWAINYLEARIENDVE